MCFCAVNNNCDNVYTHDDYYYYEWFISKTCKIIAQGLNYNALQIYNIQSTDNIYQQYIDIIAQLKK